jgi:hypothetical protein
VYYLKGLNWDRFMGQTNYSNNLIIYSTFLQVKMTGKRDFRMPVITVGVSE